MANAFHGPRSKANAKALLDAAKILGYSSTVVRTTRTGYMAPQDVVETVLGVAHIQEGVQYPAPADEPAEEPQTKPRGNGSRDAWAQYAASRGVQITDDLSRDDIKNMVEE
jgi:hypothetical protein